MQPPSTWDHSTWDDVVWAAIIARAARGASIHQQPVLVASEEERAMRARAVVQEIRRALALETIGELDRDSRQLLDLLEALPERVKREAVLAGIGVLLAAHLAAARQPCRPVVN